MALERFLKRPSEVLKDDSKYKKCFLKSMDSNLLDIEITDETPYFIGRTPKTGITDLCCSRQQLKLLTNFEKNIITIELCGTNFSGLNDSLIDEQNKKYEAHHGDIIEILHGRYRYKIEFDPPPSQINEENDKSKKIKLNDKKDEFKNEESISWETIENGSLIICTCKNVRNSEKIAAYDLDGTLIKTKSGNVHPKDINDWQILYPEVKKKLKMLHDNNFKIVIFTNQAPIGNGRVTLKDFQIKCENIIKSLSIPVQIFIATKSDFYRKPRIGMWEYMISNKNDNIKIQKEKCFYVGDAAGRLLQQNIINKSKQKHKKDHSCADRLFAINIDMQFFTPEEHFLDHKPLQYELPKFNPKQLQPKQNSNKNFIIPSTNCEMIILVGLPGSGKSYFAKEILEKAGYKIINRDTLGSIEKCIKLCEEILSKKQSCVIDNTNVDVESRKRFINLAKKYSIDCRCFVMNISLEQIKHNLIYRELTDSKHIKIKEPVFFSLKKKYIEPKTDEGFKEIVKIDSIPCKFENEYHEKLYKMYLVEK